MSRTRFVHWRAFALLLEGARNAGIDAERLTAGLGFDERSLAAHKWIPWDAYCVAAERLEDLVGGPEALERMAAEHVTSRELARLARAFVSPAQLYRFIFNVVDPLAFPGLAIGLDELDDGRMRIRWRIHDDCRGSLAFAYASRGATRAVPRYLDLPSAEVEGTFDERGGELFVTVPASQTLMARALRRVRGAVEAMVAFTSELTADRVGFDAERDPDRRLRDVERRYALTPRQAEVLGQVVRGLSNKEIAATLGCAENTVELHVTEALRKSGCSSRAQLIARFWSER